MSRKVFYIHIKNHISRDDDDFYKVQAKSVEAARAWAEIEKDGNTRTVYGIYSPAEFRKFHPWWYKFLRSRAGTVV